MNRTHNGADRRQNAAPEIAAAMEGDRPVAKRGRLDGLEAVRFYAAAAIILFHMIHIPKIAVPESLSFMKVEFGYGVPLFYAVSAFSLYYGYQGKVYNFSDIKAFYVRRFFRIAPFFYFMILVYIIFISSVYGFEHVSWGMIITSLLFIFNFIPQNIEGIVWASWSIGVEMAFYFVFPLFLLFITGIRSSAIFCLIAATILLYWRRAFHGVTGDLAAFGNFFILSYLIYFAVGVFVFFVFKAISSACSARYRFVGPLVLSLGGGAAVCLVAFGSSMLQSFQDATGIAQVTSLPRVAWAIALGAIVLGFALSPPRLLVNQVSCYLGRISFSLYLWHALIIGSLTITGFYTRLYDSIGNTSFAFLISAALTLGLVIPVSAVSYALIERPGMRLSDMLAVRRSRPQSAR